MVLFNTSSEGKVAIDMDTRFSMGDEFTLQNPSSAGLPSTLTAGNDGKITIVVPEESFGVYILSSVGNAVTIQDNSISINSTFVDTVIGTSISVSGVLDKAADIRVFIDGNYGATSSSFSADSSWSADIDLTALSNGEHEIVALVDTGDAASFFYSNAVTFTLKKPFVEQLVQSDPEEDDKGPEGYNYILPGDASFTHQQDITNIKVLTSGTDIRLELTMKDTSKTWSPTTNDFDHVAFHIFLQKSDSSSNVNAVPFLNHEVPAEMGSWDYYTRLTGWSAAIFESSGASAENSGTAVTPAPASTVDHDGKTIHFSIPAASIGNPKDLSGWKIYIFTWDEDTGNPRRLKVDGGQWVFGGADGTTAPMVIDDTAVLILP